MILTALAGTLCTLALLIGAWIGWCWFRSDHYFNDINRFNHERFIEACRIKQCPIIGSWSAKMIPQVFAFGDRREQVVERLTRAGNVRNGEGRYDKWGAEMPTFYCGIDFYVGVTFDAAGKLTDATSQGGGVCL